MSVVKAGLKLAVLVVAMLAAIGAWETYKGTVQLARVAHAQGTVPDETLLQEIHDVVVAGTRPLPWHFKCYEITPGGPALNQPVTVFDQFFPPTTNPPGGGDHLTVRSKHLLCTPSIKVVG